MTAMDLKAASLSGGRPQSPRTAGARSHFGASTRSRTVARASFAVAWMCLGVAGVSAVAAAAIYLPSHHDRSVLAPQLRSSLAPEFSESARDVALTWRQEWTHLVGRVGPDGPAHDAFIPAGGIATLLATRFPSSAHVRMPNEVASIAPSADIAIPLPSPRPDTVMRQDVARQDTARPLDIARPSVVRTQPVVAEPQLASLPPQVLPQPKSGETGLFDKLFADPDRAAKAVLAANPNTVLYDIAKRVVYMPDGEKLEAHSGYGEWLDDPESMHRKMVGVTPPNVYTVSFREKPFHGVRALRMKPVGTGNMYGRDGILAHSYLLGDAGASNGCISVKDYDKFVKAYDDGKFTQIIVLRSADEPVPSLVASAQARGT